MTDLVVEGMTDIHDIASVIEYLNEILVNDRAEYLLSHGEFVLVREGTISARQLAEIVDFDGDNMCDQVDHREECSCKQDAANMDPRQLEAFYMEHRRRPVPYHPCTKRGTHEALTDCWMCWSDFHRGAATMEEVLSSPLHQKEG